ncbi:translesion error-prone DNA polymerase V autoproteolytic subunit [Marinobacter halodurans]|uniref:translesion error-prone DNA polymerase V autoproteolytic subunit n=1 Tax=Marinobacter halodurans TaxID=2528979 RepID=UPI001F6187AB|nr:translesion error-prone DNA polymerase V autoproteolytic subunit [Marinobacter halodurans]
MFAQEFYTAAQFDDSRAIPLYEDSVYAGFPSPASDYTEKELDISELCITNPPATYFVRVRGESMLGAGIQDGDVLVVDRSLEAVHDAVIIAILDGEFLVKRLDRSGPTPILRSDNPDYPDIPMSEGQQLETFGVVTWCLHRVHR